MDALMFWLGMAIVLVVVMVPIAICAQTSTQKVRDDMYELEQAVMPYTESDSLPATVEQLRRFEAAYQRAKRQLSNNSCACYEGTIDMLRDNCYLLVEAQWWDRADELLDEFCEQLERFTVTMQENPDQARDAKAECLKAYDAFWDWTEICARTLPHEAGVRALQTQAADKVRSTLMEDCEISDLQIADCPSERDVSMLRCQIEQRMRGVESNSDNTA